MATNARPCWPILALLCLAACDKKAPPPPAPQPPAPAAPTAAAPATDPYAAIAASLKSIDEPLIYVYAFEAPLTYMVNGDPQKVRACLTQAQPQIKQLIELSRRPLDATQDPSLLGRLRGLSTILSIDSSRCFDDQDWAGLTERQLANLRLAQRAYEYDAFFGGGHILDAAKKLHAFTDAGLVPHLTDAQRHDLDAAVAAFEVSNTQPIITSWFQAATDSLNESKAEFAVEGGPARLADRVEAEGADTDEAVPGAQSPELDLISMAMPLKSKAAAIRKLTPADISKVINQAGEFLPLVETALRAPDLTISMKPVGEVLRADETQLLKLIVGCPAACIRVLQQAKADIDAVRLALATTPKPATPGSH